MSYDSRNANNLYKSYATHPEYAQNKTEIQIICFQATFKLGCIKSKLNSAGNSLITTRAKKQ